MDDIKAIAERHNFTVERDIGVSGQPLGVTLKKKFDTPKKALDFLAQFEKET
jgi:hypothetical protein